MKILKDGDRVLGRFTAVLNERFTCKHCGCLFQMEREDFVDEKAKVGPSCMQAGYAFVTTKCPCCEQHFGTTFYVGEVEEEVEDNGAPYYAG